MAKSDDATEGESDWLTFPVCDRCKVEAIGLEGAAEHINFLHGLWGMDEEGDAITDHLPPRSAEDFKAAMAHLALAAVELTRAHYHYMQNQ